MFRPDRAADRACGDRLLHPREQLRVLQAGAAGEHHRDPVRGLDQLRERVRVAGPVRLHDVRAELGAESNVAAQVLEAVLVLQLLDARVGRRELRLGDERHAQRGALSPHPGEDLDHRGLGVTAEGGEQDDGVGPEDERLLDLRDLHDLGPVAVGARGGGEQQREGGRRGERRLGDPDHPLAHHDDVGPSGDGLRRAGRDVRQRFQERGGRHPVVQRADHRHPRGVDHALQPHRLARHPCLLVPASSPDGSRRRSVPEQTRSDATEADVGPRLESAP